jgi:hypothetical protein
MFKYFIFLFFLAYSHCVYTQQLAKAKDVQIVIEPGTIINTSGGLTFVGTTNVKNNGTINLLPSSLKENWMDSTVLGVLENTSTGLVHFNSDSIQYIYGNTKFYDSRINNDSGIVILNNVEIKNQLNLDNGLVKTNNNTLLVSNPAIAAIQSTSTFATSWVNGKLARVSNVTGTEYLFPIGKVEGSVKYYAPIKLDKFNTNNATHTGEYFRIIPFDRNNFLAPPIDHISELEYWEIESSNYVGANDDDAKVSLSWRASSVVNANALVRDSLIIAQYTSFPRWEATGGAFPAVVTGTPSFGYVKHTGFGVNFNASEKQFTLASRSIFNILPYYLISWKATLNNNIVNLNWNVNYDQDVENYTIEKSKDGLIFNTLNITNSLRLINSFYLKNDLNPNNGWNYYNLKIKDLNGNILQAGVRKVWFGTNKIKINIYPNPAQNYINIDFPNYENITLLQIFNTEGQLLSTTKSFGNNELINIKPLSAGAYFIKVLQGENIQTVSFIKN